MGIIFSKRKKKSRITDVDRKILALKIQRDDLIMFRIKLEKQMHQADETTKVYDAIHVSQCIYVIDFSEKVRDHSLCLL